MPAADKIDAILARFPGPVTMPVSRLKAAGVLLGSLAFVAIGILILRYGDGQGTTHPLVAYEDARATGFAADPAAAWSAAARRCPTPTGSSTSSLRAS